MIFAELPAMNFDWISAVIGVVGATLIPAILKLFTYNREQGRSDFTLVVSELQKQIDVQRTELTELKIENKELRIRVQMLESGVDEIPCPMWVKDINHRYAWVNTAYEHDFLYPLKKTISDIVGKTDEQAWNGEIAQKLNELDNALQTGEDKSAHAEGVKFDGLSHKYTIFKFRRYQGSMQIGYVGLAIRE